MGAAAGVASPQRPSPWLPSWLPPCLSPWLLHWLPPCPSPWLLYWLPPCPSPWLVLCWLPPGLLLFLRGLSSSTILGSFVAARDHDPLGERISDPLSPRRWPRPKFDIVRGGGGGAGSGMSIRASVAAGVGCEPTPGRKRSSPGNNMCDLARPTRRVSPGTQAQNSDILKWYPVIGRSAPEAG